MPDVNPDGEALFLSEDSQPQKSSWQDKNEQINIPTANLILTLKEAEKEYNISARTLRYWINENELQPIAEPYGKKMRYYLDRRELEAYLGSKKEAQERVAGACTSPQMERMIVLWGKSMEYGLLTGKPFSKETSKIYLIFVRNYLREYPDLSADCIKLCLLSIPPEQFAKREKLMRALVCFIKFLIREGKLKQKLLDEIKPYYPKRHLPPQRTVINENQLDQVLASCTQLKDKTLIMMLAATGLRASEVCALKWEDVDLDERVLIVQCGKGGKRRRVGLNAELCTILQSWADMTQTPFGYIFPNKNGDRMHRWGMRERINRIAETCGIKFTAHSLRRAFVTINANKGRPLQMLQIACGHSDIETTMSYCRTSEQEVIDAMKDWD